jgi:uncharacterized protein (DUF885 family)
MAELRMGADIMKLSRRALLLGLAGSAAFTPLALAAAPAPPPADVAGHSEALRVYLDAQYEEQLMRSPEALTSQGRKEHYDKLNDRSDAAAKRNLAWRRKSVAAMKARFDPAKLTEEARTSFDVWAMELERSETSMRWRRHGYVFGRGGPHTGIATFLINQHRVDSKADMVAYVSRVALIGKALDQSLTNAKASVRQGVRMPRFSYDQTLDEVKRLTAGAPFASGPDSALFADAKTKIAALKAAGKITDAEATSFQADVSKAMTTKMKPAYDRLTAWLTADRDKSLADPKGAGALPDGANYYNAQLYLQTTTDMTAEQIHQLGLSEVARIRGEMEAVKARTGFTGTLDAFFVFMRTDRRFYLPDTDAGRREYIRLAEGYLGEMKKRLPVFFGRLPKADLIVKRVEPFREEPGGAQHYQRGAADGSRPGVFYAHLSDMTAMPTYQLENIAYHEGLPGHHMQLTIAQELTGLPKFRNNYSYTAYTEGWGLYTEALAKEMGFDTDPYNDFGRLSGEIWRAIRLVVDTGLHAKGWSEAQAVAYFTANSAQPAGAIASEVRRYIVTPGQATCYKIGMLKFQQLRDEARRALGARFSYPKFHDTVLGGGSLPLPVLEARTRRWIERERAA